MVHSSRIVLDKQIASEVIEVISKARKHVYLVSPYIGSELDSGLRRGLEDALQRKVRCTLICLPIGKGKDKHFYSEETRNKVNPLKEQGMAVHEVPNLHAKFYLNESSAILTSMNLSWWNREDPSREVGIRLKSMQEIKALRQYADGLMGQKVAAVEFDESHDQVVVAAAEVDESNDYVDDEAAWPQFSCIRCRYPFSEILYHPRMPKVAIQTPYCLDCNEEWGEGKNPLGHYCHKCGDEAKTSFANPYCEPCSRLLLREGA